MTELDELAATIPARRLERIECYEDAVALARVMACGFSSLLTDSLLPNAILKRAHDLRQDRLHGGTQP